MKFKSLLSAALLSVGIFLLAIYSCNKNTSTPIDPQVNLQVKEVELLHVK